MSQVIAKDNTSIGTNTVSDASTQLAKQMAVAFAQMAKVQGDDDKVLIQTSLALVLGDLEKIWGFYCGNPRPDGGPPI